MNNDVLAQATKCMAWPVVNTNLFRNFIEKFKWLIKALYNYLLVSQF